MKGVDSNDELKSFPSVKGISLMCKSVWGAWLQMWLWPRPSGVTKGSI